MTLTAEVAALAVESGDVEWFAAAQADPVVYAPHTPYWGDMVRESDRRRTPPACCHFPACAPIHRRDMVARLNAVLPLLPVGLS